MFRSFSRRVDAVLFIASMTPSCFTWNFQAGVIRHFRSVAFPLEGSLFAFTYNVIESFINPASGTNEFLSFYPLGRGRTAITFIVTQSQANRASLYDTETIPFIPFPSLLVPSDASC